MLDDLNIHAKELDKREAERMDIQWKIQIETIASINDLSCSIRELVEQLKGINCHGNGS